ncbi:glycosyltransferase family 4 protein [Cylindrospermum sp. FACHB-282]|uniref:glycosyltransferase family 4 protein n=1 Tax=Cylindrospermum sp. FACHB-282 TaxID=2692794 RepID=UPI0016860431|nr:glycosyltransferase family 4 protein [Cylindrospermum sp. FACHB-282]MBD2388121.1 glycosyltransferase family 4 protein [Cylindrospermum sp. FACHB-282]
MKILISAYACEPNQGSEPGVGWNTVCEVSKSHQVWVMTSNCHRSYIEAELEKNFLPNLRFVYLDPFGWSLNWSQKGKGTQLFVHLHYYLWQLWAYFVSRSLHKQISLDIVHHVTYVRYSSPSFLSMLPVPFIWGPVGGGESAPKEFQKDFSLRAKVYETARHLLRSLGEFDPFVQMTAKRSAVVRATTEDTAKRLYKLGANRVQIIPESGLAEAEIARLENFKIPDSLPLRFISMARLIHWKGLHLGLRAFAQAGLADAEYWILGDGAERNQLYSLTQDLGIAQQVKFWGRLPREETLVKLGESHILVHPSLHDSGGWVCMEAMAAGRPVICLDLGGPGVQVTEETGFKIKPETPEQAVTDIAKAMSYLASNPELILSMGQAGQKRVRENFSWEIRGKHLAQLYEVISTQDKPYWKLS